MPVCGVRARTRPGALPGRRRAGLIAAAVLGTTSLCSCGSFGGDDRRPDVPGYGEQAPREYLRYAADPASDPVRARFDAVTYSDSPKDQDVGEMVRSCAASRTYPVLALGERFEGLELSDVTARCQVPRRAVVGGRVVRGTMSSTSLSYGPCVEAGRGCSAALYIENRPGRAEPHRRLHEGNTALAHKDVRIGGRRAAIMDDSGDWDTIEVYGPETTIIVQGPDALARRAAEHLRVVDGSPHARTTSWKGGPAG